MTSNIRTNDLNIKKNDINIDIEIISLINELNNVRIKDLILKIQDKLKEKDESKSLRTITRALKRLKKENKIITIKGTKLKDYGIDEKDKRAGYAIALRERNRQELLEKVFQLFLTTEYDADIESSLLDIESNRDVKFLPIRLNQLATRISYNKEERDYQILRILRDQMYYMKNIPEDKESFLEIMRNALIHYRIIKKQENSNIRSLIIEVLGKLEDHALIEEIKYEMYSGKTFDPAHGTLFSTSSLLKVIDRYQGELFEMQRDLMKKGLEKNSKYIQFLRENSRNQIKQMSKPITPIMINY